MRQDIRYDFMETIKIIWLSDSPCCKERVSYEIQVGDMVNASAVLAAVIEMLNLEKPLMPDHQSD